MVISTGAGARNLLPSDPYDARILAADRCNKEAIQNGFTEALIARCKAEYDRTLAFERSAQNMAPAQRSALAIAKGLSMITVSAGYAKLDGKMTARACEGIRLMDQSLAGFDPAAPGGLEKMYALVARTRDVAIPKCRAGGHWR